MAWFFLRWSLKYGASDFFWGPVTFSNLLAPPGQWLQMLIIVNSWTATARSEDIVRHNWIGLHANFWIHAHIQDTGSGVSQDRFIVILDADEDKILQICMYFFGDEAEKQVRICGSHQAAAE